MTELTLVMTEEGQTRFTAAQLGEPIDLRVTQVGLTNADFVVAPTLTALPGEFRRVDTISGEAVGDNIVHLVIRDDEEIAYTARGFGLFLEDGTLFAVYGQAEALFQKSLVTVFLSAIDVAFPTAAIENLTFGDTNFLNPPATTTRKGVVELATLAEVLAGIDDTRPVTPKRLKALIETLYLPVGTIDLWYGDAEEVPAAWAICDGRTVARSDGTGDITTPDMRDRVPVGASETNALGATFGATSKTVDTESAGAHDHTADIPAHLHDHGTLAATVDSATTGTTFHYASKTDTASGGTGKTLAVPPDPQAGGTPPGITDPGHDHTASIDGETAEWPGAEITTSAGGDHVHEVSVDVTQPSIALHFIMRV